MIKEHVSPNEKRLRTQVLSLSIDCSKSSFETVRIQSVKTKVFKGYNSILNLSLEMLAIKDY